MGRTYRVRKRLKKLLGKSIDSEPKKLVQPEIINLSKALHSFGWQNEANLNVGTFQMTGRGIYSPKTIWKNDLIISLPIESMISIITIENDPIFQQILYETLGNAETKISSQSLLSFYLLHLKHLNRRMEYISTIPDSFTVSYFLDEQMKSNTIESIKIKIDKQQRMIDTDYQNLCKTFMKKCCYCCDRIYFDDIIQKKHFEWAFFAVNSRSVFFGMNILQQIPHYKHTITKNYINDDPNLALAPYLDLLNHNYTAKCIIKIDFIENMFKYQIYTENVIKKFQQIFINYGALDNIKLITDYGFYLPDNPHDTIEIESDLVNNELINLPFKLKMFINNHNLVENLFISRESGISYQLHTLAFIVGKIKTNDYEFNENNLKKIIYGNLNDVMEHFVEKNLFLKNIFHKIVDKLEYALTVAIENTANKKKNNDSLGIYTNFLRNRLKWLRQVIIFRETE